MHLNYEQLPGTLLRTFEPVSPFNTSPPVDSMTSSVTELAMALDTSCNSWFTSNCERLNSCTIGNSSISFSIPSIFSSITFKPRSLPKASKFTADFCNVFNEAIFSRTN